MTQELQRRRVLVIDDNESIHGDFKKTLGSRSPTQRLAAATTALFGQPATAVIDSLAFEIESALQGEEGLRMVEAAVRAGQPYALAFVDMRMPPGWDGVETIQHLWQADPELQVVICTAYSDYPWQRIIETLGVTDRLLILRKPFDPIEVCQLATALSEKWKLKRQASLKLAELEGMVHERTAELRRLALLDKLTGLPNRAFVHNVLKTCISRAASSDFKFAVLFLDFDRFKIVNDSLGHPVGDQLLVGVAERLRGLFGRANIDAIPDSGCMAARLGGDEFVIVQQGINSVQDAIDLAQRLLPHLGSVYRLNNIEVHTTASIGIATSDLDYHRAEDILRDADSAMYRAKSQGKARYALFSPDMHKDAVNRLTLEGDLRRAVQREELRLYYQPVVSLVDARLLGFEALVRWQHPERGLVPPNDFIPLAEETGLIIDIGNWVIREAARQFADWTRRLPDTSSIEVNVNCSRKQLADPSLITQINQALTQTGLAPQRLNLEITESILMEQHQTVMQVLQQIRSLGLRVHMDDFGTGYSSLNCLHALPVNVLKIDRSFVHNVSQRRDYAAVINAIITLAHNLGMEVIAEGVETADQVAMLSGLDCDQAQGYFFAKPMPAFEAEAFLLARQAHTPVPFPGVPQT
jgi:diguanylate cyclase